MDQNYDFVGWATVNDRLCSDGRTIRRDAFKDCDGMTVPLLYNHQHGDPLCVLGHALLKNEPEGVKCYGKFNNTESGKAAKLILDNGDIVGLSIFADQLKQQDKGKGLKDVLHGKIREVSLVLAGANPGARIKSVISHNDSDEEAAYIEFIGEEYEVVCHSDFEEPEESKPVEISEETIEHSDGTKEKEEPMAEEAKTEEKKEEGKTVQEVFDTMNEEQKKVTYFMIGQAIQDALNGDLPDDEEKDEGEDEEMTHNIFEGEAANTEVLSHSDIEDIFKKDWKRYGSLKDAVEARLDGGTLMHAVQDDSGKTIAYGVANIDYLFPEAKTLDNPPAFIKRNQEWVGVVMNGVHHTPFSRIKSVFADITMDEARAKGYIKGKRKAEEVFKLLKRSTTPTTVYKKQKLDKDDIRDIVDFDIVAWLKKEMRMMLDEELARAFLISDGRSSVDEDKVDEDCIRPVWKDDDLYVVRKSLTFEAGMVDEKKANAIIDAAIESQEDYEGSGSPIFFCDRWFLTRALLMRNTIGERMYKSAAELAAEMGVSRIIPVPVFKNQTRAARTGTQETGTFKLIGIALNLDDYNVGADKGGAVEMFDDFDIDYNQEKYLIETRCSGALIRPKSAIVIEEALGE